MSDANDTAYTGAGKRRAPKKRRATEKASWLRRHRILAVVLAGFLVLGVAGAGYAAMLNRKIGNIDRIDAAQSLKDEDRPDPAPGKALNILLLGADASGESEGSNKGSADITADLKKKKWPSGKYRSDTMIVMHIAADRKQAYLVSIPRDSYIDIYDETGTEKGKDKANAAFSYYGPAGAISTVENLTNLRMDHLAMIDWNGFKDLSVALGGVKLYVPETVYDSSQKVTWKKGYQNLEGQKALKYVRMRKGLENGDFDRIARQQNFIRALMKKTLSQGTMSNPVKLSKALEAVTQNLTVDRDFTNSDIKGLALAMRGIKSDDVKFMTAPKASYGTDANGGSVVNLDEIKSEELYTAIKGDDVASYLEEYPEEALKGDKQVN